MPLLTLRVRVEYRIKFHTAAHNNHHHHRRCDVTLSFVSASTSHVQSTIVFAYRFRFQSAALHPCAAVHTFPASLPTSAPLYTIQCPSCTSLHALENSYFRRFQTRQSPHHTTPPQSSFPNSPPSNCTIAIPSRLANSYNILTRSHSSTMSITATSLSHAPSRDCTTKRPSIASALHTAREVLPEIALSTNSTHDCCSRACNLTYSLHRLIQLFDEPTRASWCSLMDALVARLNCGDMATCLPFCDHLPAHAEAVYQRHKSQQHTPAKGHFDWVDSDGGVESFVEYVCDVLDEQGRLQFSKQFCPSAWRSDPLHKICRSVTLANWQCDTPSQVTDNMDTISSFSVHSTVTLSEHQL